MEDKSKEITQRFKDDKNSQLQKFELNETVKHKRLTNIYNSLHKEWQKDISFKQEQFQMLSSRKAGDEIARKERALEMMDKLKRS